MPHLPGFDSLGLRPELLIGLEKLGFDRPTPVQLAAVPPLLSGHDALVQAETGTGKTLAYALPLLNAIAGTPLRPRVLVLLPTRELALQVRDVLRSVARKWRPAIHSLVGGEPIEPQLKLLDKGVAVLVGTPGRVHDLIRRGEVMLKHCHAVVLDEADEMLLRGFKADLDGILAKLPAERQTVLVSATLGPEVRAYAQETLKEPIEIGIAQEEPRAAATLHHRIFEAPRDGKGPALERLLRAESGQAIVFVRLKEETRRLAMRLRKAGFAAGYLNGDLPQENRQETVARFRDGMYQVLVATDVAARGLDIPDVGLVVNYAVPMDPEQYVHRAGRTGRAGREGQVVTFSYREESEPMKKIKAMVAMQPLKLPPVDRKALEAVRPWRPPVAEPEETVARPSGKPQRVPKVGKHLGWFEDRPETERSRKPRPETDRPGKPRPEAERPRKPREDRKPGPGRR